MDLSQMLNTQYVRRTIRINFTPSVITRFLDKAAIITQEDMINTDGSAANPWRLCSLQQVEELKCLLRVIPIWASAILFYITVVQQSTYVVVQAQQSDRRLGASNFRIPAATFSIFSMMTLTIWIPIYDRIIVPTLRRITGKEGGITLLQRMGIGLFLSIITMLVSGLVEQRRRSIALHHQTLGTAGGAISSMSALWLVPQLVLAGLSEGFNLIGQVEFYYKQFPENMRSVAGALTQLGIALSNYLSGFLVAVIHQATKGDGEGGNWLPEDLNKGRLEYFYYLLGALGVVNFVYFLVCARWYRYKGMDDANAIEDVLDAKKTKDPSV